MGLGKLALLHRRECQRLRDEEGQKGGAKIDRKREGIQSTKGVLV